MLERLLFIQEKGIVVKYLFNETIRIKEIRNLLTGEELSTLPKEAEEFFQAHTPMFELENRLMGGAV